MRAGSHYLALRGGIKKLGICPSGARMCGPSTDPTGPHSRAFRCSVFLGPVTPGDGRFCSKASNSGTSSPPTNLFFCPCPFICAHVSPSTCPHQHTQEVLSQVPGPRPQMDSKAHCGSLCIQGAIPFLPLKSTGWPHSWH